MEDGKCLLDVINDPNALKDFLRSNSQISVEEENAIITGSATRDRITTSSSPVQPRTFKNSQAQGNGILVGRASENRRDTLTSAGVNINHSPVSIPQMSRQVVSPVQQSYPSAIRVPQTLQNLNASTKLASNRVVVSSGTALTTQTTPVKPAVIASPNLSTLVQRTSSSPVNIVRTVGATVPSDAMQTSVVRPVTTAAMPSYSRNVNSVLTSLSGTLGKPTQGTIGVSKNTSGVKNNIASSPNIKTVSTNLGLAKSHSTTPVAIQAKKPIPIQPKNPALMPQPISIQAQSSNMLKGLQYFTNASPIKQPAAAGQQIQFPVSTTQVLINGVNAVQASSATTSLQPIRTQAMPQMLLSPSQKRLAPKQQPLLPQAVLSASPQRPLQQTLQQSQQRILTPTQGAAHALTQPLFVSQQSSPQSSLQQKLVVTQHNSPQSLQVQTSAGQVKQTNPNPVQLSQVQQLLNLVQEQQGTKLQAGSAMTQPSANTQSIQVQAELFKKVQQLQQVQIAQQQKLLHKEQQQQTSTTSSSAQGAITAEGAMQTNAVLQNVQPRQNVLVQQQLIKQLLEQTQQQQKTSQQNTMQSQQISQEEMKLQQLQQQQKLTQVLQLQQQQQSQQQANMPQQQIKISQKSLLQPLQGLNILQQQKLVQQIQQQLQQKTGQQLITGAQQILQQQQQQKVAHQASKVQATSLQSAVQPNQVLVVTSQAAGQSKPIQLQQMMEQQQKQMQQILGQQQGAIQQQQQKLLVANQPVLKSAIQTSQVTTTQASAIQTPKQQPQNAAANTLQKVFIIKQPQILQKLGMQGLRPQQTVQITPQQLQALKHFQQQQQLLATNNKLPTSTGQVMSQQTTTVITQQQLKKLQLQLQQQSQGSVIKQALSQGQTQTSIQQQRQTLNQQLQQRTTQQQGIVKTVTKQLPRILQTSGRQPVNQSGLVTVPVLRTSTVVKQEANKGVKRPHSEIADVPKAATKFKQVLGQDQQGALHPVNKPFPTYDEGIRKLARYHLYHDPDRSPKDIEKSEALFSVVSNQLMKRSQKMIEKYRQLLYEESMREEPSAEMVMLYRVFLADERAALASDKKLAKEEDMALSAQTATETQCSAQTTVSQPSTTTAMSNTSVVNTVPGSTSSNISTAPTVVSSAFGVDPKSVVNKSEVAAAILSVSSNALPSTQTNATSNSATSSLTNSSSAPVNFPAAVKTNRTTESAVDIAVNSINVASSENASEGKDEETERTLEILDSILADLANQPS